MICRMCGSENKECGKFCIFCGEPHSKDVIDLNKKVDCINDVDTTTSNKTIEYNHYNRNPETQDVPIIKSYMTHSIVTFVVSFLFVCCVQFLVFIPMGLAVAAIVFAYKTEQFLKTGNIELAAKNSKLAKNFIIGSIVSLVVVLIFSVVAGVYYLIATIREMWGSLGKLGDFNPKF